MGNWHIAIEGLGCHDNDRLEDVEQMAARFVDALRASGVHSVTSASVTIGATKNLMVGPAQPASATATVPLAPATQAGPAPQPEGATATAGTAPPLTPDVPSTVPAVAAEPTPVDSSPTGAETAKPPVTT